MGKTAKSSKMPDLFADAPKTRRDSARRGAPRGPAGDAGYTAKHIEVLEGLEPVRRRPGMYIGGTDEKALHHLFAEVIDNAMDEALAGHADWIEVEMAADGFVTVTDNGRGIPVDPHPKFKNKSALEVIMCTLHAGGKFDSKVYETSGGLHGVGVSVANALSERMEVEVARGQRLYRMAFERGKPKGKLQDAGKAPNRRGTKVRFRPDPEIFGAKAAFQARARVQDDPLEGLSVRRRRNPLVVRQGAVARASRTCPKRRPSISPTASRIIWPSARRRDAGASRHFHRQRRQDRRARRGAMGGRPGPPTPTAFSIPTATPSRRPTAAPMNPGCARRCCAASRITPSAAARASAPPPSPATTSWSAPARCSRCSSASRNSRARPRTGSPPPKRSASSSRRSRTRSTTGSPAIRLQANKLLDFVVERAEERLRRRQEKEIARKSAVRKLRLPGKLADCTQHGRRGRRAVHRRGR